MDLGTSVTISTGIVMAGVALITLLRGLGVSKPKNGAISREEFNKTFKEKLDNVIYKDTCLAMREGCHGMMKLTQENVDKKFKALTIQMSEGFKDLKEQIKEIKP